MPVIDNYFVLNREYSSLDKSQDDRISFREILLKLEDDDLIRFLLESQSPESLEQLKLSFMGVMQHLGVDHENVAAKIFRILAVIGILQLGANYVHLLSIPYLSLVHSPDRESFCNKLLEHPDESLLKFILGKQTEASLKKLINDLKPVAVLHSERELNLNVLDARNLLKIAESIYINPVLFDKRRILCDEIKDRLFSFIGAFKHDGAYSHLILTLDADPKILSSIQRAFNPIIRKVKHDYIIDINLRSGHPLSEVDALNHVQTNIFEHLVTILTHDLKNQTETFHQVEYTTSCDDDAIFSIINEHIDETFQRPFTAATSHDEKNRILVELLNYFTTLSDGDELESLVQDNLMNRVLSF